MQSVAVDLLKALHCLHRRILNTGLVRAEDGQVNGNALTSASNPRSAAAELATFVGLTLMQDSIETEKPPTMPGQDVPAISLVTSTKVNRYGHHTLPPSVVEEIRTWIYRHRLDGKAFIRGGEGHWA